MQPQLITTIDEVRAHVPVNMTEEFEVIAPFLRAAETKYIIKLIGPEQFKALAEAGTDDPETNNLAEAKLLCQKAIANLAYFEGLPVLSVSVGSSGVQVFSNENTKQAFQWQVEDLKDALVDLGFTGIEELLILMEDNANEFDAYHQSEPFKKLQSELITSATEFSEYYDISSSRYLLQAIQYIIRRVEQQVLAKVVGTEFLKSLKQPGITEKQKILVNEYLKPGLALLSAAKAIVERVITIRNGSAVYNFRGNYENMKESLPATREQIQATREQLEADGYAFLQDGLAYINANLGDMTGFTPPTTRRRFKITNDPGKGVFAI